MGFDDRIEWGMFPRTPMERPRRRIRYKPGKEPKVWIARPQSTRPKLVETNGLEIKNLIKGAILAQPEITVRELGEQFDCVSLIALSAIRSQFLADLRILDQWGKLIGVVLPKMRRTRCA